MLWTLCNAIGNVPPPAPRPPFSWVALLVMLVVLGASVAMYVMLVRRWTSRRQWVSLAEWTRESGFRLRAARRDALPEGPLRELVRSDAQVRFHLSDPRITLVQFETDPPTAGAPAPRWNVVVRRRQSATPARVAALRPASQPFHLIDLLPLSSYAALALGERFIVYATESSTAHAVADSTLPALLPPDLGLILLEEHIVLDFSARPFDAVSFGRLIALAEQLAQATPA